MNGKRREWGERGEEREKKRELILPSFKEFEFSYPIANNGDGGRERGGGGGRERRGWVGEGEYVGLGMFPNLF